MRNIHLSESTLSLRRCLAVLLLLCLSVALVACSEETELATHTNSVGGYSFSYPETWSVYDDGKTSCISIADVGGALPYAIVRFNVFDNDEGVTAAAYWNSGVEGFSQIYDSYTILQDKRKAFEKEGVSSAFVAVVQVTLKGETKLDGQPEQAGEAASYTVCQLVFEGDGRICVVSYMSSDGNYDTYSTVMDDIKESFAFTTAEDVSAVVDGGVADFIVPVPQGWSLETADAYYSLRCGKATIVACVYSLETAMTPKDYWENVYRGTVTAGLAGFKERATVECELDGVQALDIYYTAHSSSGNEYSFRQCLTIKSRQVYIITLTASAEDYEAACEGYEAVKAGFCFK